MAENKKVDLMAAALNNRVDNYVQIELQRRQFGNRYKRTPQPGEPVGDYQSIGVGDYQVNKPAWAVVRSTEKFSGESSLIGSALSLFENETGKNTEWKAPTDNFTHNYEIGQDVYLSEYGSGGSYRPKPGLRTISTTTLQKGVEQITINFKCFDRLQLNNMSNFMTIGHEFLVMFGFGSVGGNDSDRRKLVNLINPETDKSILETGIDSVGPEVAAFSQGTMWARVGRVKSFDINFTPDDSSFDVTTVFLTKAPLESYAFQDDTQRKAAVREILTKPNTPENEKKEDTTYEKYSQFIEKLRGYSSKIDFDFILPTQESLYSIGQEVEDEFTELMVFERNDEDTAQDLSGQETTETTGGTERQRVEDREPLPGFERVTPEQQQKVVKIIEEENSDKSLTANECREIFSDGFGELNLNHPMSVNGKEQLAFAIKNDKGKGNRKVNQTYIPWAVCEWIFNNGVHIKKEDGGLEVVLQKYSQYTPPRKVFFVPMKEEIVEVEEPTGEGSPPITVKQTVFSDDVDKLEVVSEVAGTHENYIRTLQLPHVSGSGVAGSKNNEEFVGTRKLPTMGLLKDLSDRVTTDIQDGKMISNVVDAPELLFSIDPGICIITDTIPTNGIVEPKIPFRIHELDENYKFFMERQDESKGYIRNILINAEYFYGKLIQNQDDVELFYGLKEIVDEIFTDVSNALGGVVGFKTEIGEDGELQVVDVEVNTEVYSKTELDTAKENYYEIDFSINGTSGDKGVFRIYEDIFPLNNFGQDSIVRDMNFSLDTSAKIAAHFFWNGSGKEYKSPEQYADDLHRLLTQKQAIEQVVGVVPEEMKDKIKSLKEEMQNNHPLARTYLREYLESAARTYSTLVPSKNGEVSFSVNSVKRVLNTKLKKILTSSDLNQKVVIGRPFNVPQLPVKVEVTLDGISGIKLYDKFYLSYVPPLYGDGHFKVMGITHSIQGTDWFTKLNLLYVPSFRKFEDTEDV